MKKPILLILLTLITIPPAFSQPPQSENFMITKSVLDAGGGRGSSADFRLTSAFGQPSPLGAQTSENFSLSGGFLSPLAAISPLSPIQALVIQGDDADVYLYWERVSGAVSYQIYRGTTADFAPAPGNRVGGTSDTSYVDSGVVPAALRCFYIVTASTVPAGAPTIAAHPVKQTAAPATKSGGLYPPRKIMESRKH